jgi:hypothetical protein
MGTVFRSKRRMRGLRFEATDVPWSWGDGKNGEPPVVRGRAEAILMSTLGRDQALEDCEGDGVPLLRARCVD